MKKTNQSRPTVLITTSSFGVDKDSIIRMLDDVYPEIIFNPFGRKLTESEVKELIQRYQPVGLIAGIEPLTKNVLDVAGGLAVISRCGAGLDSVDLSAARERGIVVRSTPDAVTIPVAELTVGLILGLLRRIHLADASIRSHTWERPMGRLLFGKTIGIIGLGRIGSYLARLLAPFGCPLLGYDIVQKADEPCEMTDMDTLITRSDIVTLHLPYSPENHHVINGRRIGLMKEGAVLVNAARGGLVDEKALFDALSTSRLSGAALDCFEDEPYTGALATLPNVLLTSHIGSYAVEARSMMEQQAVDNLREELEKHGISS